jgi:hypothetical protein
MNHQKKKRKKNLQSEIFIVQCRRRGAYKLKPRRKKHTNMTNGRLLLSFVNQQLKTN